ncbi:MAG: hypothetical protein AAF449_12295, partial [Myxococcota bacterium]
VHCLMGGGIVLETDAPILGSEVSYILDSPRLAPTLSRNAVRRDQAFDALLRGARAKMPAFRAHVARQLRVRSERLQQDGTPPERGLDANDRAALEWLRSQLLLPEDDPPDAVVRDAPVLETADGSLVSANELIEVIRKEGRVPISRVPRTREEIGGYADRGIPVLLLYRDLEDFLERQSIETVEVDGLDDGVEVAEMEWGRGEAALAARSPLAVSSPWRRSSWSVAAVAAVAVLAAVFLWSSPTDVSTARPSAFVDAARVENVSPPADNVKVPEVADLDRANVQPPDAPESQAADLVPFVQRNHWSMLLAAVIAVLWVAAGLGMIFSSRRRPRRSWLRTEAGAPLTLGENRKRRWNVVTRALLHPVDFLVARGWSIRASGRPLASSASASIKGYREFAPEVPIRSGVRLDLDRVELGFVDLVSRAGDPNDGRFLLRRQGRILLNRNHPTVGDLITIAESEPQRARVLLDMLLATDADLGRGTDPRQVEWDLLGRAEVGLRPEKS